jgi:hypothetical protein
MMFFEFLKFKIILYSGYSFKRHQVKSERSQRKEF